MIFNLIEDSNKNNENEKEIIDNNQYMNYESTNNQKYEYQNNLLNHNENNDNISDKDEKNDIVQNIEKKIDENEKNDYSNNDNKNDIMNMNNMNIDEDYNLKENEEEEENIIINNQNNEKEKEQKQLEKNESNIKASLSASKKRKNTENKNLSSSKKSNSKNYKLKAPQSGELLFNPKKPKKKPIEPLFSKYEQLEPQVKKSKLSSTLQPNSSLYKKSIEVFPSQFGTEMPYKSQLRESNYSSYSIKNMKLNKTLDKRKSNYSEINSSSKKKENNKLKKYSNKNYYTYKSNIKSDNPFVGLSQYDKTTKERKNMIAQAVEKEENEFNEIIILEGNISQNRDLNDNELNQLINTFTKYLFEQEEKNLENKNSYEFKINKVSNMIKNMKRELQNKVLEGIQKGIKDEYSKELFEKLSIKINEFKEKLDKVYIFEKKGEDNDYFYKASSTSKKNLKKGNKK